MVVVKKKMQNPVRKLREQLGLNQSHFADLIGRSFASVQSYEKGRQLTAPVLERLREIAREKGLEFDETPADGGIVSPQKNQRTPARHQHYQDMLNEILDSGDPDYVKAVVQNLELFHKLVERRRKAVLNPKENKKAG